MCGIAAYNGSVPVDFQRMLTLGILNESRGTHSCGIIYKDVLSVGVGALSEFRDLAALYDFEESGSKSPITNNVIIHTRHSTSGTKTTENCHPFGFNYTEENELGIEVNQDKFLMVGCHNGTIEHSSVTKLRKDYGLDYSEYNMDSKVLLGIIMSQLESGNIKVLQEYKGAAALVFYTYNDPDTLYLWKGAAGGEERPLHFVQVKDKPRGKITGCYISSLEEHLSVILDKNFGEIKEVEDNHLYMMKGGKIKYKKLYNRGEELSTNYYKRSTHTGGAQGSNAWGNRSRSTIPSSGNTNSSIGNKKIKKKLNSFIRKGYCTKDTVKVLQEELQVKKINLSKKRGVIFHRGFRYFSNGHLVDGLHMLNLKGKLNDSVNPGVEVCFINGIMVTKALFDKVEKKRKDKTTGALGSLLEISKDILHPVTWLPVDQNLFASEDISFIYFSGKVAKTSTYTPVFSDYSYDIVSGVCKKITLNSLGNTKLSIKSSDSVKVEQGERPRVRPDSKETETLQLKSKVQELEDFVEEFHDYKTEVIEEAKGFLMMHQKMSDTGVIIEEDDEEFSKLMSAVANFKLNKNGKDSK